MPNQLINEISPISLTELLERVKSYYGSENIDIVEKAYEFSAEAHKDQYRKSGEPYVLHPLGVAGILSDLKLDIDTIITGLLHDTVEDTSVTLDDISKSFGTSVSELVDGVTKISQMQFRSTHEKQGENIRKMILAMGKDIRVILVKLADRLHNMRTLTHMPAAKQKRIAQETLDIYAPLASRLGISSIKIELEDLGFRFSQPEMFYQLVEKVAKKKKEREKYINDVRKILNENVSSKTSVSFSILGRPKHLYSIHKKMQNRNIDYEQVYDVLAFRIIVGSISECYEVLGHVHSLWKPIPGRFKDYIAIPKANNYRSLHTTVVGPGGERIEIQIRTNEMELIAEQGIAAHWSYKEKNNLKVSVLEQFNWMRDMVQHHQQTESGGEFLEDIKTDLFESEIYIFTPKGDLKEFPEGATPIDFAYSIHTDVGFKCTGARVNGRLVSIKTPLKNGDRVEVITSDNQTPSKDWLNYCVTSKAKNKIRWYVKNEERKRAKIIGEQILEKDLRKIGVSVAKFLKFPELPNLLKTLGANDIDDLHVRLGYGVLNFEHIIEIYNPSLAKNNPQDAPTRDETFLQKVFKSASSKRSRTSSLVQVDGLDDILVSFAKCCNPIPGEEIVGFISRGRGVIIHRESCEKVYSMDKERSVGVEWNVGGMPDGAARVVTIRVVSHDIPGLLKNMSEAFSTMSMNIINVQIRTTKDKKAICFFETTVKDTSQLSLAIQMLHKIDGILSAERVTQS